MAIMGGGAVTHIDGQDDLIIMMTMIVMISHDNNGLRGCDRH